MKNELKNIISELKEVIQEEKLNISDNCILEQACTFLRGEFANKRYSIQPKEIVKPNPATDKQIQYLKKVGKYKEGMTKNEAFDIISELNKNRPYKEY